MRSIYRLILTAGLVLVLASCASDDGESAELTITTPEAESTTTETTTTAIATTTVAVDPVAEAEVLIRASAQQGRESWVQCTNNPAECEPETLFAVTGTGGFYSAAVQVVQNWQAEMRIWRHPDDIEDNGFLRVEEIVLADDLLSATVTVCERDGRAGWIPDPDGKLVMLEETYGDEFNLAERTYVFEDGSWKNQRSNVIARSIVPGEKPVCEPEP